MRKKSVFLGGIVLFVLAVVLAAFYLHNHNVAVLNPEGLIANKERRLIIIATALSMIVVIPVFAMTFGFAWKYRASNTRNKAEYRPDWGNSRLLETVWWGVPTLIIIFLSVLTWQSSHELDPYKPLNSSKKPVTIQVVSLQWKWLFIYPDQHVASVNFAQIPANTPINFEITSDAPMNSFWVPQLGGQIYAMTGMSTQLHLMANKAGSYKGSSANISGDGFAGMNFTVKAGSDQDFNAWVARAKQSAGPLTQQTYGELAKQSKNNPVSYYANVEDGLYDTIVMKYMEPTAPAPKQQSHDMEGMDMSTMNGMDM